MRGKSGQSGTEPMKAGRFVENFSRGTYVKKPGRLVTLIYTGQDLKYDGKILML